ncbi:MAG: L-aspartate semialdehyde sulfurtransferase [Tepidanaerobacteraceae bacterium]|nr:L-aspartate semialdehyde sulfurtransferase [Tepidanaerobacteraceae bacterium]
MKTFEEINEKIKSGRAVVLTAQEVKELASKDGIKEVAKKVDVVTTATFGAMCSSGAFLNFGHADPPIKMSKIWLNDVPAYGGIAAVDAYIGATEQSESEGINYGGAHVIEDLVAGKKIKIKAISKGTDCYPRREFEGFIDKNSINQAILFNPRNAYQNYNAATNTSDKILYTYMGTLLPNCGNVNYSTTGELSPLMNDPYLRTIGVGTRIFLGGAVGYVAWEGTQHNPMQERAENGVPIGGGATLALIGDLKNMSTEFLRAAVVKGYGVTLYVGVGIPIPVLDEEMARFVSVRDEEIFTNIIDYAVPSRSRPVLRRVSYAELKSGSVTLMGRKVPTAPLSSFSKSLKIAEILKSWIKEGKFLLQEPVQHLPLDRHFLPLNETKGEL